MISPVKKKVTLPTGPMNNYTHWKQTVFYMDQVLDLKKGDLIEGTIDSRPNGRNPRDLDIKLEWAVKTAGNDESRELKGNYNYIMR